MKEQASAHHKIAYKSFKDKTLVIQSKWRVKSGMKENDV